MKLLNKKVILPLGALMVSAAPIATVVSCGNHEDTAEENQRSEILASGSDYLLQQYLSIVNKNEYKLNEAGGSKKALALYEEDRKAAWKFWASSKLKDKDDFWYEQVKNLLTTGVFKWADFIDNKKWVDYKSDKPSTLKTGEDRKLLGKYPSWNLAKEIMKKKPTLTWNLEIENLLMVQNYMTSFKKAEYKKLYKKKEEEPVNLDAKDKNFFLVKYLHSNTPIIIWKQAVKGLFKAQPQSKKIIENVNQFNLLARESLLKTGLGAQAQLTASKDNGLTIDTKDLYAYQGVSTNALPKPKGEIDNTEEALRKRLNDDMNESGWINEDGNIEPKAKVIYENETTTSIFGIQFFPWMEAYSKKDGKRITDVKKKDEIDDDKSFWRIDSNLRTDRDENVKDPAKKAKNIKDNALARALRQKLIFTLVDNNQGLINDARKFMLDIRKYNLRTNNDRLESILSGKGVMKED